MSTVISILKMAIRAFLGCILACCFISGTTADVPDGVVYTDLHQNTQLGSRAVLKCEFYRTPLAVYWKKGDNPSTAQNLITWFGGKPDSGSCVKDKTCDMGDDYSLIIKDISVADQGRYICRVSNYRGILLHNFTDVKVYASPEGPYPVIQECAGYHGQNCTVDHSTSINITCSASRYFPSIDLLFLHGARTVKIIKTFEWTNADGTKSKYIFTRAPPSKIPYVCVAFNIPGSQDERTATILVFHQDTNGTSGSAGESEGDKSLIIKIVVPVGISVLGLCIPILLCCAKCLGKEKGTKDELEPILGVAKGRISLYELWLLACSMTRHAKEEKLRDTLKELGITNITEGPVGEVDVYQALHRWRAPRIRPQEQANTLEEALKKFELGAAWKEMKDGKEDNHVIVPQEILEHMVWNIADANKVDRFLHELNPNRTASNASEDMEYVVENARRELSEWSEETFTVNPFVLLSLALEEAECKSAIDQLLFSVPSELKLPIQEKKLEEFIDKLIGRHCRRLAIPLKYSSKDMDKIIFGNNYFVFNTRSMMNDWLNEEKCSNYEKRCRLDDAIITIGRYDLQDFWKTIEHRRNREGYIPEGPFLKSYYFDHESIFDDDIPQLVKLVKCLPSDKKAQFNKKMGLNPIEDADDDDTINYQIKEWRNSITITSSSKVSKDQALEEFQSFREFLTNSTTYRESNGNTHTTKSVDREEFHHIALSLLMEDVHPIIKALDIDQSKVSKYVKERDGKGDSTIDLVIKLLNRGGLRGRSELNRDEFCKALRKVGFVDVARSVYFGRYKTESQEASSSGRDICQVSEETTIE